MMRRVLKVAAVDVVVLAALFYVVQDLQWRVSCAAAADAACTSHQAYSSSFSYGLVTQVFTMAGNSVHLVSPATIDWVQILIYLLVLLNGWLVYASMKSHRAAQTPATGPSLS